MIPLIPFAAVTCTVQLPTRYLSGITSQYGQKIMSNHACNIDYWACVSCTTHGKAVL